MNDDEKINIIEIGAEGIQLLSEIHILSFENSHEQAWGIKEFQDIFSITGSVAYLISRRGEPAGFILVRKIIDEAEIITFCILPKYRNNGYATYLLESILNKLQLHSIKRLFLEVREDNEAAIRLYEKKSFKIIGRRKGYYNDSRANKIDALVMHNELSV